MTSWAVYAGDVGMGVDQGGVLGAPGEAAEGTAFEAPDRVSVSEYYGHFQIAKKHLQDSSAVGDKCWRLGIEETCRIIRELEEMYLDRCSSEQEENECKQLYFLANKFLSNLLCEGDPKSDEAFKATLKAATTMTAIGVFDHQLLMRLARESLRRGDTFVCRQLLSVSGMQSAGLSRTYNTCVQDMLHAHRNESVSLPNQSQLVGPCIHIHASIHTCSCDECANRNLRFLDACTQYYEQLCTSQSDEKHVIFRTLPCCEMGAGRRDNSPSTGIYEASGRRSVSDSIHMSIDSDTSGSTVIVEDASCVGGASDDDFEPRIFWSDSECDYDTESDDDAPYTSHGQGVAQQQQRQLQQQQQQQLQPGKQSSSADIRNDVEKSSPSKYQRRSDDVEAGSRQDRRAKELQKILIQGKDPKAFLRRCKMRARRRAQEVVGKSEVQGKIQPTIDAVKDAEKDDPLRATGSTGTEGGGDGSNEPARRSTRRTLRAEQAEEVFEDSRMSCIDWAITNILALDEVGIVDDNGAGADTGRDTLQANLEFNGEVVKLDGIHSIAEMEKYFNEVTRAHMSAKTQETTRAEHEKATDGEQVGAMASPPKTPSSSHDTEQYSNAVRSFTQAIVASQDRVADGATCAPSFLLSREYLCCCAALVDASVVSQSVSATAYGTSDTNSSRMHAAVVACWLTLLDVHQDNVSFVLASMNDSIQLLVFECIAAYMEQQPNVHDDWTRHIQSLCVKTCTHIFSDWAARSVFDIHTVAKTSFVMYIRRIWSAMRFVAYIHSFDVYLPWGTGRQMLGDMLSYLYNAATETFIETTMQRVGSIRLQHMPAPADNVIDTLSLYAKAAEMRKSLELHSLHEIDPTRNESEEAEWLNRALKYLLDTSTLGHSLQLSAANGESPEGIMFTRVFRRFLVCEDKAHTVAELIESVLLTVLCMLYTKENEAKCQYPENLILVRWVRDFIHVLNASLLAEPTLAKAVGKARKADAGIDEGSTAQACANLLVCLFSASASHQHYPLCNEWVELYVNTGNVEQFDTFYCAALSYFVAIAGAVAKHEFVCKIISTSFRRLISANSSDNTLQSVGSSAEISSLLREAIKLLEVYGDQSPQISMSCIIIILEAAYSMPFALTNEKIWELTLLCHGEIMTRRLYVKDNGDGLAWLANKMLGLVAENKSTSDTGVAAGIAAGTAAGRTKRFSVTRLPTRAARDIVKTLADTHMILYGFPSVARGTEKGQISQKGDKKANHLNKEITEDVGHHLHGFSILIDSMKGGSGFSKAEVRTRLTECYEVLPLRRPDIPDFAQQIDYMLSTKVISAHTLKEKAKEVVAASTKMEKSIHLDLARHIEKYPGTVIDSDLTVEEDINERVPKPHDKYCSRASICMEYIDYSPCDAEGWLLLYNALAERLQVVCDEISTLCLPINISMPDVVHAHLRYTNDDALLVLTDGCLVRAIERGSTLLESFSLSRGEMQALSTACADCWSARYRSRNVRDDAHHLDCMVGELLIKASKDGESDKERKARQMRSFTAIVVDLFALKNTLSEVLNRVVDMLAYEDLFPVSGPQIRNLYISRGLAMYNLSQECRRGSATRDYYHERSMCYFTAALQRRALDDSKDAGRESDDDDNDDDDDDIFLNLYIGKLTYQTSSDLTSASGYLMKALELVNLEENRKNSALKSTRVGVIYQVHSMRIKLLATMLMHRNEVNDMQVDSEVIQVITNMRYAPAKPVCEDEPFPKATDEDIIWDLFIDAVKGLRECRRIDNYDARSVFRIADVIHKFAQQKVIVSDPAIIEQLEEVGISEFSYGAALKELKKLFDRKRHQVVGIWCHEGSNAPYDQILQRSYKYESLRTKYYSLYLELLERCGEWRGLQDMVLWTKPSKKADAMTMWMFDNACVAYLRALVASCDRKESDTHTQTQTHTHTHTHSEAADTHVGMPPGRVAAPSAELPAGSSSALLGELADECLPTQEPNQDINTNANEEYVSAEPSVDVVPQLESIFAVYQNVSRYFAAEARASFDHTLAMLFMMTDLRKEIGKDLLRAVGSAEPNVTNIVKFLNAKAQNKPAKQGTKRSRRSRGEDETQAAREADAKADAGDPDYPYLEREGDKEEGSLAKAQARGDDGRGGELAAGAAMDIEPQLAKDTEMHAVNEATDTVESLPSLETAITEGPTEGLTEGPTVSSGVGLDVEGVAESPCCTMTTDSSAMN